VTRSRGAHRRSRRPGGREPEAWRESRRRSSRDCPRSGASSHAWVQARRAQRGGMSVMSSSPLVVARARCPQRRQLAGVLGTKDLLEVPLPPCSSGSSGSCSASSRSLVRSYCVRTPCSAKMRGWRRATAGGAVEKRVGLTGVLLRLCTCEEATRTKEGNAGSS
jgi:hypothetical protein